MVINMAHKCEDCAKLKKRHKIISKKEYFRMCLEGEEYMSVEDAKVLHDCVFFIESQEKRGIRLRNERLRKREKRLKILRKQQKIHAIEEDKQEKEKLRKWRKKMKDRWKR